MVQLKTKRMEENENRLDEAEQRVKELKQIIKEDNKRQEEKVALAIGKKVLRKTNVHSDKEFTEKYLDKLNADISIDENKVVVEKTNYEQLLQKENKFNDLIRLLNKAADEMSWTGNFWKINNLKEFTSWLADNFRTENSSQ